jgi:arylsulfatase A-like enzyme
MTTGRPGAAGAGAWVARGFAAGLALGTLEGAERAIGLAGFLGGPLEQAALFAATLGFVTIAGIAAGAVAAAFATLARALERAGLGARPRRALVGLVAGAAAGAGTIFALTLTTRFDAIIARCPAVIGLASLAGAILAPAAGALAGRLPRGLLAPGRVALAGSIAVLFAANLLFAPQSSTGVHVLLDATTLVAALALAASLPLPAAGPRAWALAAVLLVVTHGVMVSSERVSSLVKTRGVTARRAVRGIAWLGDVDRDGYSPALLTAGWDTAPFDRERPSFPWSARGGAPPDTLVAGDPAPPGAAVRANLLLLSIDALRGDVVPGNGPTPLGSMRPATPHLDSLAAASALFETSYAPSAGTEDSFSALFSGGWLPGILRGVPRAAWLPERLSAAGYRVAAFVDDRHFTPAAWGWRRIEGFTAGDPAMAVAAIDSLAAGPAPAFVWTHWMALHAGVLNPLSLQAYSADAQRRRYASGLAAVDAQVGRLLSLLRERGLAERTLVVLTADHGEELGEHGHYHHNLSLFEPAVRVPLWIAGPGVVPGARRGHALQRDLHATIARVALAEGGARTPSLWPRLTGADSIARGGLVYLFLPQRGFSRRFSSVPAERGQAALVDPARGRKVMLDLGAEHAAAFDLDADPGERLNLAGSRLPWVREMRAALDSALRVNAFPASEAGRVEAMDGAGSDAAGHDEVPPDRP